MGFREGYVRAPPHPKQPVGTLERMGQSVNRRAEAQGNGPAGVVGWSGLGSQPRGGEEARTIVKTRGVGCELDLQSRGRAEKAFQPGEAAEARARRGTKPLWFI